MLVSETRDDTDKVDSIEAEDSAKQLYEVSRYHILIKVQIMF